MARGFIRNPLDVRLLILYILDHLILPVTMAELTDLALCDDGVDYFQFATALGALTENGHVAESEEGLLSITEKGHDNCSPCKWQCLTDSRRPSSPSGSKRIRKRCTTQCFPYCWMNLRGDL